VRRGRGMRRAMTTWASASSSRARFGPQAVVSAAAVGQHRRRVVASDVDPVGTLVHSRVAVGRGGVGDDQRVSPGWAPPAKSTSSTAVRGVMKATGGRCMVSSTALGASSGCSPSSAHVGLIAKHLHRGGQLVAGGAGVAHQQAAREHKQLVERAGPQPDRVTPRHEDRQGRLGTQNAHPALLRAARRAHPRPGPQSGVSTPDATHARGLYCRPLPGRVAHVM
jgi:hypothetical protein